MKKRRTQSQWQKLLDDYEGCGLSVLDFCAKHKLSKASFYRKRAQLKAPHPVDYAGFVRLEQPLSKPVETQPLPCSTLETITLNIHTMTLHIPQGTSVDYVAKLIGELS